MSELRQPQAVITGLGTVNPLGLTVEETWKKLLAGESGIDYIKSFDPEEYNGMQVRIAAEVKGFDVEAHMGRKEARRLDRFSQFAVVAAEEALKDSGLEIDVHIRGEDVATIIASGIGGLITTETQVNVLRDRGVRRVSPFTVPMMMPNGAAAAVSMKVGSRGISFAPISACSSAADAIGLALDIIRSGRAKVVIAGGSEAIITPIGVATFQQAGALSTKFNHEPKKASRPFQSNRDGFVLGEGAGILVIEEEEFARSRGATVIARFVGYGATADSHHITEPHPEGRGAITAVQKALHDAGCSTEDIMYINAHGTSTPLNDKTETLVIKKVFGNLASNIPVNSTKSMTGHLGGASGAIEAVICAKVAQTRWAPPTINQDAPDPNCDLDYIPEGARELRQKGIVLSNSLGFGGHNSCLGFQTV